MLDILRKLQFLLDKRERRNARVLLGLILLMSLFETVGVASLMPFLTVLANPDIIQENVILNDLFVSLEFSSTNSFLLFLGGMVLAVVIIGLFVKIGTYWALSRFANMRNYSLSSRLLQAFLAKPYIWFLTENSADLHKKILSEVQMVVDQTIIPLLRMLSSGMILLFLVCLLIWMNPLIAVISAFVIGGVYIGIYVFLRDYLQRLGRLRIGANEKRFTVAQESLSGVKQVKASGLESYCIDSFREPARRYAEHLAVGQVLGEAPRFVLEAIAIGGMLTIVLVLLAKESTGLEQIIPIIGVYGFAGMRVLPAIQQVYQSATKLRFSKPALDVLYEDMKMAEENMENSRDSYRQKENILPVKEFIGFEKVFFRYSSDGKSILSDLNLNIKANSTVAFVGSTGSGKTTLVDIIMGLLPPSNGRLVVDGAPVNKENIRSWQRSIGYVPQHIFLSDDTVVANIAYGVHKEEINFESVKRAAKMAEIHDFITQELEQGYETEIGERGVRLSGGQCQRIAIARALYYNPDVLILDEATSALDNNTEKSVMSSVYKSGHTKTIIIIAHRLSTVERCDNIFLMERGEIVASGTYSELSKNSSLFREMISSGK